MKRRDFAKTVIAGAAATTLAAGRRGAEIKQGEGGKAVEKKKFYTIDAYGHFSSLEFIAALEELSGRPYPGRAFTERNKVAFDPGERLAAMDECGVDASVLISSPFIESVPSVYADPNKAAQAARVMNDNMAKVVSRYPKRFAAVALLPTVNADVMLAEFERAVTKLHMAGGCFAVSPLNKPSDHPDYMQLYSRAAQLNVPLWIHPSRPVTYPDYAGETDSKWQIAMMLGWPVDSSVAMCRIAFSGVFDKHPDLKIIIHHRGGLIPSWWSRITGILKANEKFMTVPDISRPYENHLKKFYCDTASSGHEPGLLRLSYDFFGPDRVLYGTDSPNDDNRGLTMSNDARYDVEHMGLSDSAMKKIFSENLLKIIPRGSLQA
jgi:predicted TIM-barrel fold metal-dependent hydrolase